MTLKYIEPIKNPDGTFTVVDNVNIGYTDRMSGNVYYTITSIWSKELILLNMLIADDDVTYFFSENGTLKKDITEKDWKFSYHGRRALLACNCHLNSLKIYLGLLPKQEEKREMYIYREYYDDELRCDERTLNKDGTPKFSKHSVPHSKATPEKLELMQEYNTKLTNWKKTKQEISDKIFEDYYDR